MDQEETAGWMVFPLGERRQPVRNFRGNGKYISSFLGFAKADNPAIIGIVLIDEPHGTYYGGTIAAPVMRSVFQTALPYMGIYKEYTPDKKEP